jgi:choline dehydrogenase-like flavoprotein
MIRYTSELADTGPNDMQLIWFTATGATDADLRSARLLPAVMRVFSRGTVRLASDDPRVDPQVDFNLLSDRRDRERLNDGVRRAIELLRHSEMEAVVERVTAGTTPIDELSTPEAIDAWCYANVADYVHAAGTCAMGSVVDTECRVIGYDNLRVCDASVMPDIPKANTHLTTVAIAHRVSDMIMRR